MVARSVDYLSPWQVSRPSVGLFVEKIAPAADRLSQWYNGRNEGCRIQEFDFIMSAYEVADDKA